MPAWGWNCYDLERHTYLYRVQPVNESEEWVRLDLSVQFDRREDAQLSRLLFYDHQLLALIVEFYICWKPIPLGVIRVPVIALDFEGFHEIVPLAVVR